MSPSHYKEVLNHLEAEDTHRQACSSRKSSYTDSELEYMNHWQTVIAIHHFLELA